MKLFEKFPSPWSVQQVGESCLERYRVVDADGELIIHIEEDGQFVDMDHHQLAELVDIVNGRVEPMIFTKDVQAICSFYTHSEERNVSFGVNSLPSGLSLTIHQSKTDSNGISRPIDGRIHAPIYPIMRELLTLLLRHYWHVLTRPYWRLRQRLGELKWKLKGHF